MIWSTRGGSALATDLIAPGDRLATKTSRALLLGMTRNFKSLNLRFHREYREFPFVYSERSLRYVVASAFEKAGKHVFVEQPVWRSNSGEDDSAGWLDFWVRDPEKKITFLIEYKHRRRKRSAKVFTQEEELWNEAVEQTRNIADGEIDYLAFRSRSVYRIALMSVGIYQTGWNLQTGTHLRRKEALRIAKNLADSLYPRPNWLSGWVLEERLQKPVKTEDASRSAKVRQNSVIFVARVERIRG